MSRLDWLNGWGPYDGETTILLGPAVHCIGCGRFHGITTVAVDDEWPPPDATTPDWPFPEHSCPVCRYDQALIDARDEVARVKEQIRARQNRAAFFEQAGPPGSRPR